MRTLSYRSFLVAIVVPMVLVVGALVGLSLWLQPLEGDLTRLGGYAENDYGWTGEQVAFRPSLAWHARPDEPYDVVVLGDSFSRALGKPPGAVHVDPSHWTDFFAARTGLSVGVYHRDEYSLQDLLRSDAWRSTPPRLLIVEYAERTIGYARADSGPCDDLPPPLVVMIPRRLIPAADGASYVRPTRSRIGSASFDAALDCVSKALPRWAFGYDSTSVSKVALARDDLFTDWSRGSLLLYRDDLAKRGFPPDALARIGCRFRRMQAAVEANGVTRFVLMVAPDRSAAYRDYLPDLGVPDLTAVIARTPGMSVVRVDLAIRSAFGAGMKDVYLPDDTHWATAGKRIAAAALDRMVISDPAPSNRLGDRIEGNRDASFDR